MGHLGLVIDARNEELRYLKHWRIGGGLLWLQNRMREAGTGEASLVVKGKENLSMNSQQQSRRCWNEQTHWTCFLMTVVLWQCSSQNCDKANTESLCARPRSACQGAQLRLGRFWGTKTFQVICSWISRKNFDHLTTGWPCFAPK